MDFPLLKKMYLATFIKLELGSIMTDHDHSVYGIRFESVEEPALCLWRRRSQVSIHSVLDHLSEVGIYKR